MTCTGLQGSSGPVTPPQAASEPGPSSLVQPSEDAADYENKEEKGLSEPQTQSPLKAHLLLHKALIVMGLVYLHELS